MLLSAFVMTYLFGEFELDPAQRELRVNEEVRPLQPQVFDLLLYLIEQHARVVPKGELLEQLEFGGVEKVSVVRKKGSVTITHEVNQRAAMKEALWALRVANNREHGSQIKLPQSFGSSAVSTSFSNATLH